MAQQDALFLDRLLAPERGALRYAGIVSALAATIWPVQAALVAQALARLLMGAVPYWPGVIGFALLGVLRAALSYGAEGLAFRAGLRVVQRTRAAIVAREAVQAEGGAAGSVAALAAEKLDLLLPYVSRYGPARCRVAVVPLIILALAVWQSWAVAVVLLISGPLIPVFMALIGWAAQAVSQRQLAEIASLHDLLVERLSALLDIRLLGAGDAMQRQFTAATERLRAQTMAVLRVAFLSSAVLELFAAIGVAMVAVYVGFSLLGVIGFGSYGTALSPAAGIFLLLLAPEFFQPLRDLSGAWHDRAQALAVAAELAAWQARADQPLLGQGVQAARLAGVASVQMAGVRIRRGGQVLALPDFRVEAGEKVALVGASGTGKTAALRAIAGLLAPEAGQILVAGQALRAEVADGWRARLGWMPQAPHFLNASLRHNIGFGRGDVMPALHAAAVLDVVAARGLEARLGETGAGLSGGEARRVTLARALHKRPDVLLADEPTADLDEATAQAVVAGLLALSAQGCTLIIATHDMALAAQMDRVIRLGEAA